MNDTVLIVGAGPTGLSAAAGAASVGKRVVLVEKENRLGGAPILSGYAKLVPSGEWAKDAIGRMIKRVEDDPRVTIHKGVTDGSAGTPVAVPLRQPLTSYFTATVRGGSSPSPLLDLLGHRAGQPLTLSYARIRLSGPNP